MRDAALADTSPQQQQQPDLPQQQQQHPGVGRVPIANLDAASDWRLCKSAIVNFKAAGAFAGFSTNA